MSKELQVKKNENGTLSVLNDSGEWVELPHGNNMWTKNIVSEALIYAIVSK